MSSRKPVSDGGACSATRPVQSRTTRPAARSMEGGAAALHMVQGAQLVILGRFDATLGYPIDYVRQVTGSSQSVRIRVHRLEVKSSRNAGNPRGR